MTRTANSHAISYTAIVAAAGRGSRMGGPKALLAVRWGEGPGELPLAIAHARAHLDGGAERVVVVVRAEVAAVLSRFRQRGLDIVVSTAPDELGPAGSIKTALELLRLPKSAWVMIEPVDMPSSSASIRRELLAAAESARPQPAAVRPVFGERRGHPVLVRREHLDPMVSPTPPPLRDVLHALDKAVLDVPVPDPRATTDLDTPEDVVAFYGSAPRFFVEDEPTSP
ncbi:MAG: NTP transferase domain-containing protein [Polyangiaceae bacterium]